MPSYTLELELLGVFSLDMPEFEIWADGVQVGATYSVPSVVSSISVTPFFAGSLPSSLELRFNDASGEAGRTIEIHSVKINDRHVNTGNFLSSDVLVNGGNATVDIAASDFIFDNSAEPAASEFTTGATQTFTNGHDSYLVSVGTTNEVFDLLGDNDFAYLGSGDDKVSGGAGNDTLRGGAGNDLLFGDTGNDRIYGEDGNDLLYGGDGNDTVHGNDGDDEIHGGEGNDRLVGHTGNDTITGGLGNDSVNGGSGNDHLFGDDGEDFVIGGAGDDTLDGGAGDDVVYGGAGNDHLDGGDGNDIMSGSLGNDVINGGAGDDTILGGADDDIIRGGGDADILVGGTGVDDISGGTGNDTINLANGDFGVGEVISGDAGTDELVLTNATTVDFTIGTLTDLETLTGSAGDDDVTYSISQALDFSSINLGSGTDNSRVQANGTQDVTGLSLPIVTNAENGFLTGSTGDDDITITGAQVNALIFGTGVIDFDTGTDVLILTTISSDLAILAATDGGIIGLEEIDYSTVGSSPVILNLTAQTEDFIVSTANGQDIVTGGSGDDTLNGNIGNDDLFGGLGNDTIIGGQGFDDITGGAGADIIDGGTENDRISGGGTEFLGDTIDGGAGTDDSLVLTADATFDTTVSLANIERITFNSGGNYVVNVASDNSVDFTGFLASGNSVIRGAGGNETITGTESNDTIQGGNGADILSANAGNDFFIGGGTEFLGDTFDGGLGTDTIDLFADSLFNLANTFTDVERLDLNNFNITTLAGQGYNFTGLITVAPGDLFDSTGNETISGSESSDDLVIGVGADIVNGNAGNDRFFLSNGDFAAGESLTGDAGTDSIILSNATTIDLSTGTIATIETFLGSAGNDDVTYTFSQLDAFGSVNLLGGTDNSRVQANGTLNVTGFSLPSVNGEENGFIVGSSGDDDLTITGAQVNTLIVGAGTINFGGGDDALRLTATSSDLNILGSTDGSIDGLETIDFSSATANTTVDLNGQTEGFIIIGSDQLDNITTGDGDDTITGGDGDDIINTGDGDDTISGNLDNDMITAGSGVDDVDGGGGDDTINLANGDFGVGESIDGNVGTDELILTDATTVDFTTGTLENLETLTGSAGDDDITIEIDVLAQFTTADLAGGGNDTVRTQIDGVYDAVTNGVPTVTNAENGFLIGSANADTLTAGETELSNLVYGTGTIDFGGNASDTLVLTTASTTLDTLGATDASIQGLENIDASAVATDVVLDLGAQTEDFNVIGSGNDDVLTVGSGDDDVDGGAGADTIYGEDGGDILNGGSGNDLLFGDTGGITFSNSSGSSVLVIEAENFETNTDRSGNSWSVVDDATASGGQVVIAQPNTGTIFASTGIEDVSPELTYTVNFDTTGTFYVWIKAGVASGGANDSVHLGFDGVQQTGNGGIRTGSNYGWHNTETGTGTVVTVNVATVGIHTLNLWVREDGAPIDSILITDDSTFVPTGLGPDESVRTSTSGGVDTLNGGDGDDILHGDFGDDILNGGNDNDTLIGGVGVDFINGGANDDTISLANGDFGVGESIAGGTGTDEIILTNATTVDFATGSINTVETLRGSAGNDDVTYTIQQALDFNTIDLGGGIDNSRVQANGTQDVTGLGLPTVNNAENGFLTGSTGDDDLTITGAQVNTLIVGAGTIDFGGGDDVLRLTTVSSDLNMLTATNASIIGLEEIDMSIVTSSITLDLSAQTEDFIITAGTSSDTITGGTGADTISGGDGNDTLSGEAVTAVISTSTQGWNFQYYDLTTFPANLSQAGFNLNSQRDNTNASITAGTASDFNPDLYDTGDDFALKFETTLTITTAGTYTFRTNSDDGTMLFLDGAQIINNDGSHGPVTVTSAGQTLAAGTYTLELTYFEDAFGTLLEAEINGPDTGGSFVGLANYSGANVVTLSSASAGEDDFIAGGGGTDVLYGGGGADTFIFEAVSAFAETDTITDFSTTDGDRLDISDIITGAFSGDIKDYLQFTSDGATGDTLVQVDANGTAGGTNFLTVARLEGIVGLDEVNLFNAGDIIV